MGLAECEESDYPIVECGDVGFPFGNAIPAIVWNQNKLSLHGNYSDR